MDALHRVSKTDLARKTRQIIRDVQRGLVTVVESHGQAEVAILDIVDFRILQAAAQVNVPGDAVQVPDEAVLQLLSDEQARYNRVLSAYLGAQISLGRMAELLGLAALDARFRLARLGITLRIGEADSENLQSEVDTAVQWSGTS